MVLKIVLGLVIFFVILNIAVYFLTRYNVIHEEYLSMVSLDREGNLPTFYATVLLLPASVILLFIGLQGKQKYYWYLLSSIFCFLVKKWILPCFNGFPSTKPAVPDFFTVKKKTDIPLFLGRYRDQHLPFHRFF